MEGYVEHAVDARILILRPRNFLHPDEILKFVFSSEKTNIQKSSAALILSIRGIKLGDTFKKVCYSLWGY